MAVVFEIAWKIPLFEIGRALFCRKSTGFLQHNIRTLMSAFLFHHINTRIKEIVCQSGRIDTKIEKMMLLLITPFQIPFHI